jgi:hypothetical protein
MRRSAFSQTERTSSSIRLGGLGQVTLAEAIVVGVVAGLVTLAWRYMI